MEGVLWKNVRGLGLAYGCSVSQNTDQCPSLLVLSPHSFLHTLLRALPRALPRTLPRALPALPSQS